MKNIYLTILLLCCFFFQSITILSQTSIFGKITELRTGEELPFVNILVSENDVYVQGKSTDFDGNFSINVEPGKYDVEISYSGYRKQKITNVLVIPAQKTQVDFKMILNEEFHLEITLDYKKRLNHESSSCGSTTTSEIRNLPTRNANNIIEEITEEESIEVEIEKPLRKIKENEFVFREVKYFPNPATTSLTLQSQESISEITIIQSNG